MSTSKDSSRYDVLDEEPEMERYLTPEEAEQKCLDVMGPDLGRFYSLLVNECSLLHLEWAEYKVLFGTSADRIGLLNQAAPAFFGLLQNAQWETVLLHIARLMDPVRSGGRGKDNVTLLRLPSLVDDAIRFKIDILLSVAQQKCGFSLDWRNRRIAHNDLDLALKNSAESLPSASRLIVDSALEAIAAVLNVVESHYRNGATVAYQHVIEPLGGAMALLQILTDGLEAHAASERRLASGEFLPEDFVLRRPV